MFPEFNEAANNEELWGKYVKLHTFLISAVDGN
jgi:hypothetical protein